VYFWGRTTPIVCIPEWSRDACVRGQKGLTTLSPREGGGRANYGSGNEEAWTVLYEQYVPSPSSAKGVDGAQKPPNSVSEVTVSQ
jgi:hypothetical protein